MRHDFIAILLVEFKEREEAQERILPEPTRLVGVCGWSVTQSRSYVEKS
jgi:hypothetical protein